jgi:HlyD family secretion protein
MKIEPQAVVDQNVTMFPVLIHLQNDERLLKPGMNTEVEIEVAQRDNAIVVPNDAVVAMRDATTAGKALGLSEDAMRDKMNELRNAGSNGNATPTGAPGTQVAQAQGSTGPNGQAPANGAAAQQQQRQMSPECSALFTKSREKGRESLSDEERTKMRACFRGMGGNNAGRSGFGGGMAGGRRGSSRPGIVFVPGANGPEPRMVTLGVNDWDYTEVISGLKEGDKVFLMTAARLAQQQKEQADRMRQRSSGALGGMRQQPGGQNNNNQGGGQQGGRN